jgi:hypothetical protein
MFHPMGHFQSMHGVPALAGNGSDGSKLPQYRTVLPALVHTHQLKAPRVLLTPLLSRREIEHGVPASAGQNSLRSILFRLNQALADRQSPPAEPGLRT